MTKSGAERLKESFERKKQQTRDRVQRFRAKKKEIRETYRGSGGPFKHRGAKKRAVDKVKDVLPVNPEKKAAVLSAAFESPTALQTLALKGLVSSKVAKKKMLIAQLWQTHVISFKRLKMAGQRIAVQLCSVVSLCLVETMLRKVKCKKLSQKP